MECMQRDITFFSKKREGAFFRAGAFSRKTIYEEPSYYEKSKVLCSKAVFLLMRLNLEDLPVDSEIQTSVYIKFYAINGFDNFQ